MKTLNPKLEYFQDLLQTPTFSQGHLTILTMGGDRNGKVSERQHAPRDKVV